MTLKDFLLTLESEAKKVPSIRTIIRNDVFRLNEAPDVRYGAFAYTQRDIQGNVNEGFLSITLVLFYVDRLTEDSSNEIDVQSEAVMSLDAVIRGMDGTEGIDVDGSYSMTTFNQRFSDLCAGAFATVTFRIDAQSMCGEVFGSDEVKII